MAGLGAIVAGEKLGAAAALARLSALPHLICHSAFLVDRLAATAAAPKSLVRSAKDIRHFDVAELFAFVVPARVATPTPAGFARALGVERGDTESLTLQFVVDDLLARISNRNYPHLREAAETANFLVRANWPWSKLVLAALLKANPKLDVGSFAAGLNVWDRVEEWEDDGIRPPGTQHAVAGEDAETYLSEILGHDAEPRPIGVPL